VDLTRRTAPVHVLVATYNLALGLIWLAHWRQTPYASWIAATHLSAVTLPWLLVAAPPRRWSIMAAVREIYPLIMLLAFWTEIELLRDILGHQQLDPAIEALDLAVFGVHLHAVLLPRLDTLWISEPMFFAYYVYYGFIFGPPILLAALGRRAALCDATLRLMATYLTCYAVYIAFPVYGPHFIGTPYQGPHTAGLFYHLVAAAQRVGDAHGCAFPSSHVAGVVTIAVIAWRWFPRGVAALFTVEALGVVVATVYTQNHYGVDSLAGIAWALAIQLAVVPALVALFAPGQARRRAAPLRELAPALQPFDSLGGGA
jgi:membrane-associated phospholipid phosphatase